MKHVAHTQCCKFSHLHRGRTKWEKQSRKSHCVIFNKLFVNYGGKLVFGHLGPQAKSSMESSAVVVFIIWWKKKPKYKKKSDIFPIKLKVFYNNFTTLFLINFDFFHNVRSLFLFTLNFMTLFSWNFDFFPSYLYNFIPEHFDFFS